MIPTAHNACSGTDSPFCLFCMFALACMQGPGGVPSTSPLGLNGGTSAMDDENLEVRGHLYLFLTCYSYHMHM